MSEFIGRLSANLVDDDLAGLWRLMEPLSFHSDLLARTFTAPVGFETDFCSVPRVPLAYDLLGNRARKSGTIHDLLYTTHEVTREQADQVLREMLLVDGVNECEAEEFYLAVRMFGASHWGEPAAPTTADLENPA